MNIGPTYTAFQSIKYNCVVIIMLI